MENGTHREVRANGSIRIHTHNTQPSKADPSFQDEVDVNTILAKFHKTGQVTHLAKVRAQYGDVSEIPDLATCLMQIKHSETLFMALPSAVRTRFGNDPLKMIEFVSQPENKEEGIKLGLINKPAEPTPPLQVEVTNQPTLQTQPT